MRYLITQQLNADIDAKADTATVLYREKNRALADARFVEVTERQVPGYTLRLVDSNDDKVISTRRLFNIAEMEAATKEYMERTISGYARTNDAERLAAFAAKVTGDDPSHAMRWADSAFESAANVFVGRLIAGLYADGVAFDNGSVPRRCLGRGVREVEQCAPLLR